jgi:hypothetical protein
MSAFDKRLTAPLALATPTGLRWSLLTGRSNFKVDETGLRCGNVIHARSDWRLRLGAGRVLAVREPLCHASKILSS